MLNKLLNKKKTDEDVDAPAGQPLKQEHADDEDDHEEGLQGSADNISLPTPSDQSRQQSPATDDIPSSHGSHGSHRSHGSHDDARESDCDEAPPVDGGGGFYSDDLDNDINVDSFDYLRLDPIEIEDAGTAWNLFLAAGESRQACGEMIYGALFEGAPSLQQLFTTPRAVQAMKFMDELAVFVAVLDNPEKLHLVVETLGFKHMQLDVTIPRVLIFRDSILDLLDVELADKMTYEGRKGWLKLLNYVGGAIIYVKSHYAERVNTLLTSWQLVNSGGNNGNKNNNSMSQDDQADPARHGADQKQAKKKKKATGSLLKSAQKKVTMSGTRKGSLDGVEVATDGYRRNDGEGFNRSQVPTTYNAMFRFNAAVMGFGNAGWMNEVLACFNNIVLNVANSQRLQEECDVLVLRIAKVTRSQVNFAEYKSCMLASLRALLPKDWSTNHEVAWTWLWDNVERLLARTQGSPPKWEKALSKLWAKLTEEEAFEIRKEFYSRFFTVAPAGQDLFKQSNTYLHFIAERQMAMTLELYRDPVKMTDDISALGLRHVGYAIPTELFGPYVSVCVDVLANKYKNPEEQEGVESFRWSMALISKMLVRTISEGSTIVMRAINSNSTKQLRRALTCAPRCERSSWMLIVQVGTQSISPLAWAVESGAFDAAREMITDLLTIRADRDKYYCGMEEMFRRHPDIVKKLCDNAPALIPTLLDGLIWRSRTTDRGVRRVNYYIKSLLVTEDGRFHSTLAWLAKTKDPKLVRHPVLVLLSDIVWARVASRAFLMRKSWFLFSLLAFILAQSVLRHTDVSDEVERNVIFSIRAFIYLFSMTQLIMSHLSKWVKAMKRKDFTWFHCVPVPRYLDSWQDVASLALAFSLIVMLILEPILWCLQDDQVPTLAEECSSSDHVSYPYTIFSTLSMILYFMLLIDLAVLSTKVSAYVLVCIRMLSEVWLFVLALFTIMLTFGSSMSVVQHEQSNFNGIQRGFATLIKVSLGTLPATNFDDYEDDPIITIFMFLFMVAISAFLLNMLIAQLTCAYEAVYADMVGYARLERIEIIVVTMPVVSESRWKRFVQDCHFDSPVEFGQGDLGLAGGLQTLEAANLNPTTVDTIRRYGGSTSPEMQWPADSETRDDRDTLDRMEKILQKMLKRLSKSGKGHGSSSGGGDSMFSGGSRSHSQSSRGPQEEGSKSEGSASHGSEASIGSVVE